MYTGLLGLCRVLPSSALRMGSVAALTAVTTIFMSCALNPPDVACRNGIETLQALDGRNFRKAITTRRGSLKPVIARAVTLRDSGDFKGCNQVLNGSRLPTSAGYRSRQPGHPAPPPSPNPPTQISPPRN